MSGIDWLRWDLDSLAAAVKDMMHEPSCASRKGFMVGGISFDVNEPPHAREVKHACDCRLRDAGGAA